MDKESTVAIYDVVIIGAGPAGCASALRLKDSGLKVALIDRSDFPRDKVCGDAIPGRAIKTLNSINPEYAAAFKKFPPKRCNKKTTLFYKKRSITFTWVLDAFTCARYEFDNFLFSLVKEHTETDIYTNTSVHQVSSSDNCISLSFKNDNKIFQTKILIGADGAHSVVAKQLAGKTMNPKHNVAAVRAYFQGLPALDDDTVEVYFNEDFLPSYLWIFPVAGNKTNVGFGILSAEISKRKVNIKKTMFQFIEQSPVLKERFSTAKQLGDLEGFGLPLGSDIGTISGHRFMLCGDAASLIDPASGDGIGNAMLSGKLAAEQVIRSFKENNFSASFMKEYDNNISRAIGKELKQHYLFQRIVPKFPFLLDIAFLIGNNKLVKKLIKKVL